MSQWGGCKPPQIASLDSPHQQLPNDISFVLVSLASVAHQLSAVLANLTFSPSPASFTQLQLLLLQSLTNISTITHTISLQQLPQPKDNPSNLFSPSPRNTSSEPLHTIRILTDILALTPSSSCLSLSVTNVDFVEGNVSAPKSRSNQNILAAVPASIKPASTPGNDILQSSSTKQTSPIHNTRSNTISHLPLSVMNANVVKPNVSAPTQTCSLQNSYAAVVASTSSASSLSAKGNSHITQPSSSKQLSHPNHPSSESLSTTKSRSPLSVVDYTNVVKPNVSAPTHYCSLQNSPAAVAVSTTLTSNNNKFHASARNSSINISSTPSCPSVSEINRASEPISLSSKENTAISQTQITKQSTTTDPISIIFSQLQKRKPVQVHIKDKKKKKGKGLLW
jgi:hypothetical protein